MKSWIKAIEYVNEKVGEIAAFLCLFLVVLVCLDVAARALFNYSAAWIMELEWHVFACVFLLGGAYTLKQDQHVRVDLFYSKFRPKDKALVNLIGGIVLMIPFCLLLLWVCFFYAYDAFQIQEGSPDPGGLPFRFVIKGLLAFSILLLLLQTLVELHKQFKIYSSSTN